jgi:hypothetical protein
VAQVERPLTGPSTRGVGYTRSLRRYDTDARTARHGDRLSVLDWAAASAGSPLSKALLPAVEFDYHVKDIPGLCSLCVRYSTDRRWARARCTIARLGACAGSRRFRRLPSTHR